MEKRIVKKYHVKDEIKGVVCFIVMACTIWSAMFYQAEKVEEERQQKEKDTIQVAVNFNR